MKTTTDGEPRGFPLDYWKQDYFNSSCFDGSNLPVESASLCVHFRICLPSDTIYLGHYLNWVVYCFSERATLDDFSLYISNFKRESLLTIVFSYCQLWWICSVVGCCRSYSSCHIFVGSYEGTCDYCGLVACYWSGVKKSVTSDLVTHGSWMCRRHRCLNALLKPCHVSFVVL